MPLIRRFMQNALPHLNERPQDEWEWLFVMQHHGLPTRLLDWTESPLTALYFAVSEDHHDDADGVLWSLLPLQLNEHSKLDEPDIPGFGGYAHLEQYLPSKVEIQKVQLGPIAAISLRNTPRMQMQQGVFTVCHKNLTPLDEGDAPYLWRYTIPKERKPAIREELKLLHITKLSLFPELPNVAKHALDALV